MKEFMGEDFLLDTETARILFREGAQDTPIFDWHCHLSPKEIYEDQEPEDIAALWLGGDHYKWRAMRSYGIEERYITGDASGYEKFKAYASIMPACIGNPLYHWSHLELRRYFGINEILSERTADAIWAHANEKIHAGGFTPRRLIEKSNVAVLCTTDDPADTLEYHQLLQAEESFHCRVLPAFRPDKALGIEQPGFPEWIAALEKTAGEGVSSFAALCDVLKKRIAFFDSLGCRASDHAFGRVPYAEATQLQLEEIFEKGVAGEPLTQWEMDAYRTALLQALAREYARLGWGMELHIGPMRNNNTRMFRALGPDTGFDSCADDMAAYNLSRLLDSLDAEGNLPRTVLFALNPKDNYVLSTMLGNFQNSDAPGKLQFGSAWWFNDHIDGMREQMRTLANTGVLGRFVGMVTDSRSFLSYPRHEYFRRILCGLLGDMVEAGWYPAEMDALTQIVKDISYYNAVRYFGIE
ncbi:MAG TPA: glucuronate isomerase [Candidatus Fimivicinus intestinavium]|nr:glucuronate isomerase [Candidatus Fimivicinus intestinavium]